VRGLKSARDLLFWVVVVATVASGFAVYNRHQYKETHWPKAEVVLAKPTGLGFIEVINKGDVAVTLKEVDLIDKLRHNKKFLVSVLEGQAPVPGIGEDPLGPFWPDIWEKLHDPGYFRSKGYQEGDSLKVQACLKDFSGATFYSKNTLVIFFPQN
jgi:hypothetical protein